VCSSDPEPEHEAGSSSAKITHPVSRRLAMKACTLGGVRVSFAPSSQLNWAGGKLSFILYLVFTGIITTIYQVTIPAMVCHMA
jgi:uncharacterized protein YaaW (UPF0174 family)